MAASDGCGGNWHLQSIEERTRDLVPLPGFIGVTSLAEQPDMITFENNEDEKRAIMPCGHVIGPHSMTSYVQSLLSAGKFKFFCPSVDKAGKGNCNREWKYSHVRHVACLTPDEMKEFEKRISDNYLQKASGYQTCPGCETWCCNEDGKRIFVECPLCKKRFCWACTRDWIGPSDSQSCGNSDCDGKDSRTQVLNNCQTKPIGSCLKCPTIRACTKCGMMAEHKDNCAHVVCLHCGKGFCFICLKGKNIFGRWSCSPAGTCTLAPRQTSSSWQESNECSVM